ncbi:ubiquinone anaerobic biosynthesis accessory factor UbiT [Agrobacterium tumefaciens]|uniref:ubiquinone anaerobic biosynthesis accessory factor UbiT n=1 Tax=Agrobacterium tumefaciens TaxID=358 RepID=UPI001575B379|nr:SCP2 domain-containing protein [Agrobacterium tumefaciens]
MRPFPAAIARPMNFLPLAVVQRATAAMLAQIMKRHPDLFGRLGEHCNKRFTFLPVDLPFAFMVEPARPAITVSRKGRLPKADAAVEGPLFMLLALMEGRQDADALFFSRDLSVTGDMEATLALRNALDDSGIDLPRDLGSFAGPFAPVVTGLANRLRGHVLSETRGGEAWN